MLQEMSERYKGWVASVIVIIIAVTFGLWSLETYVARSGSSDVAAKVNGSVIRIQQFSRAFDRTRNEYEQRFGVIHSKSKLQELKQNVLHQLINSALLAQTVEKMGFVITPDQAGSIITKIPAFQAHNQFSPELYKTVLAQMNYDPKAFLLLVRQDMMASQLKWGITATQFVLPYEINDAIHYLDQSRSIEYVEIPQKLFSDIKSDDIEQQKNYYQKNIKQFETPEKVSIEYVTLSMDSLLAKQQISDSQLKDYYDSHLSQYTKPEQRLVAQILIQVPNPEAEAKAKAKINDIYFQLKKGGNFAALAKKYSEDVITANKGGVLPWIKQDTFANTVFEQALFSISKVGDITKPIRTKYGWQIFRLLAIKPKEQVPFENAKIYIHQTLAREQAEKEFANVADDLANLSYTNPTSLQPIASQYGVKIQTSELFDRDGLKSGTLANKDVVNSAFSENVLRAGNNSQVIQVNPTTLLVLRLHEHQPPKPIPFEQVQNQIQSILTKKLQQEKTKQLAEHILDITKKNEEKSILEHYKLSWVSINDLNRETKNIDQNIVTKVFQLSPHNNSRALVTMSSGNYAVVKLKQITPGDIKKWDNNKRRQLQQTLQNYFGEMDYQNYLAALEKDAKIRIYLKD